MPSELMGGFLLGILCTFHALLLYFMQLAHKLISLSPQSNYGLFSSHVAVQLTITMLGNLIYTGRDHFQTIPSTTGSNDYYHLDA